MRTERGGLKTNPQPRSQPHNQHHLSPSTNPDFTPNSKTTAASDSTTIRENGLPGWTVVWRWTRPVGWSVTKQS